MSNAPETESAASALADLAAGSAPASNKMTNKEVKLKDDVEKAAKKLEKLEQELVEAKRIASRSQRNLSAAKIAARQKKVEDRTEEVAETNKLIALKRAALKNFEDGQAVKAAKATAAETCVALPKARTLPNL